jgi:hypothetical protein
VAEVDAGGAAETPVAMGTDPAPLEAEDAGAEPEVLVETASTTLDDFTIGERKREKRIDDHIDEMKVGLKGDKRLAAMFGQLLKEAVERCEGVRTVGDFRECEDQVETLYRDYQAKVMQ